MTDKEYTELDRSQNEIYKCLDEIDEILSRKTKEERLEYFSKIGFPKSLNFNLDFGKSVIMVRTHLVVSRIMRKFDSGIWQKSITGGVLRRPLGYVWAVGAQRVKGGGSRLSCP